MERLTKEEWVEWSEDEDICSISEDADYLTKCYQKLGKLEDIEEELGIPLEVLFKALLRGILDEDGRHHSKVRLSNKLGYIGLVDEEGYCWDTKKYLSKWWILGGEYDD